VGNVFAEAGRNPAGFETPQQRVGVFVGVLLAIAGEYLVITRVPAKSLAFRRAVRVVCRQISVDERLFPLMTATAMNPHRYWPALLNAAWNLATSVPEQAPPA